MNIKSEKESYANELKQKALRFNADIFVWGEELIDKKVILYPKKLKDMEEYDLIKEQLEPCGIVLIDTRKSDFLYCTSATINTENGYVYFPEGNFNSAWKFLKNSIAKGIRIAEEQTGTSPISKPEDVLVFDYLMRQGSTPVIENDVIKYVAREMTDEEKYKNSRKQSLMDNPKMLYFYSDNSRYYHDKECDDVKDIIAERFRASDTMPDGKEMCPKCRRKLLFRIACYPNTRQMPICDRIFKKHHVSDGRIQHYVMDVGMKFHATDYSQMHVEGIEDNWIIKGLDSDIIELWHNNYVKTSSTERYITDGYHNQKVDRDTLGQLLNYIETYSWQKHLQHEGIKIEKEEPKLENIAVNDIDNISYIENTGCETHVREKWYLRILKTLKGIFLKK